MAKNSIPVTVKAGTRLVLYLNAQSFASAFNKCMTDLNLCLHAGAQPALGSCDSTAAGHFGITPLRKKNFDEKQQQEAYMSDYIKSEGADETRPTSR